MEQSTGAALVAQCLKEQGVKQILGIPGTKIDRYSSIFVSLPEIVEFETARLGLDGDAIKETEG